MVAQNFEDLVNRLLESNSPKKWFRAYFNHGLINYIFSQKRLLPCDMSFDTFFIDPYGDVMPCNGTKEKEVMELRQKYFGNEGEMRKKEEALIMPIQNQIYEIVKEISMQKGYDIVIDRASANSMIYASPKIDISNEILRKLGYSK